MDALFEQRIIQNEALGAEALWQAVADAFETSGRVRGVQLPLTFVVLPIVFHRRSAEVLSNKTQPGAMYKALADDREITVGLQERMQRMWKKTQKGIALAVASGLIKVDQSEGFELVPARKTNPVDHLTDETRMILAAAKRVGQALAEMPPTQLMSHLHIRF